MEREGGIPPAAESPSPPGGVQESAGRGLDGAPLVSIAFVGADLAAPALDDPATATVANAGDF